LAKLGPLIETSFSLPPPFPPLRSFGLGSALADSQRTNTVSRHTSSPSLTKPPSLTTVITSFPTRKSVSVLKDTTAPKSTPSWPTSESGSVCISFSLLGETRAVLTISTCEWIQETYGITNPTLVANNPQIDEKCENIYVGEVLCVDTDDYVYPEVNQTIYQVSP
jgi:hypothetical protein